MKLIDADELKKRFIGNRYGVKAIYYQIDNTPTANAITIEWLKRYELAKGQEVRLQDAINEWKKEYGE